MIALQVFEQFFVHTRNETRVDKRCIDSGVLFQLPDYFLTQLIERTKSENGNLFATARHFIAVQQLAIIPFRIDAA